MLAIPLLLLGYSTLSTHKSFSSSMEDIFAQGTVQELTANLQHNVMDLQRNALIYKDTASKSAIKKSEQLYKNIKETIQSLESNTLLITQAEKLERMEHHLSEYKNNFDIVVSNRNQQEELVSHYLFELSPSIQGKLSKFKLPEATIKKLSLHLHASQRSSLSYLATQDSTFINTFKKHIEKVEKNLSAKDHTHPFLSDLKDYKRKLLRIVTLKRNYIYLINVVMAGSAYEVLFLAEELTEFSQVQSMEAREAAEQGLRQQRQIMLMLLGFGLLMAIITPLYFSSLIIQPIQRITRVFKSLSDGEAIERIPAREREDEIGLLAKAADVFKAKNEQTHELLEQAKQSVLIQKDLNKELASAKNNAEKALSVKSDFLANMSHELRTPLNSVIGFTVRLLKKSDEFSQRQLSALNAIERNGKHLLAMINDILDLSKMEANKLEMRFEIVNIHTLCEEVIHQLRPSAEERSLDIIYEKNTTESLNITTDPIRLTQVLINLLSNSIKYTEKGWVKINVEVDSKNRQLTIHIEDTGIGIKEEDMERLFQRFEQFDADTRFKIGHGTGLGLAIVDNISRLLGASISAKSEERKGSTFSVKLPFEPPQQSTLTQLQSN